MAGAGAALPLDAMDAAQNPAKMVFLGNRMDFGVAAFLPERSFTANDDGGSGYPALSPGTYDSESDQAVDVEIRCLPWSFCRAGQL